MIEKDQCISQENFVNILFPIVVEKIVETDLLFLSFHDVLRQSNFDSPPVHVEDCKQPKSKKLQQQEKKSLKKTNEL